MKFLRLAAVVALVAVTAVAAQDRPSSDLRFEAASIRPSALSASTGAETFFQGNRLRATRTTLVTLIRSVYSGDGLVSEQQFVGGPDWIRTERWDINAVALGHQRAPSSLRCCGRSSPNGSNCGSGGSSASCQ